MLPGESRESKERSNDAIGPGKNPTIGLYGLPDAENEKLQAICKKHDLQCSVLDQGCGDKKQTDIMIFAAENNEICQRILGALQDECMEKPFFIARGEGLCEALAPYKIPFLQPDDPEDELLFHIKAALYYGLPCQQAEEALLRRETLLGLAAHDLTGPFSTVLGYINMLKKGRIPGPELSPEQTQAVNSIESVAARLLDYVEKLLDRHTLLYSERKALERVPVSLSKLWNEAFQEWTAMAADKDLDLEVTIPESAMWQVDADLFRRVLANLASNAVRFSPPGTAVRVFLEEDSESFRFCVQNERPVLRAAEHAKLFSFYKRFFSHDTSGKRGTGMGLSLAALICDAHGFRLTVESNEEDGNIFRVVNFCRD